jgi:hypothetical protein
LDFEKAFDLVEHSTILEMLHAKGFPPKWLRWIEELLSLPLPLFFLMALLEKILNVPEVLGRGIPSPLLSWQYSAPFPSKI